MTFNFNSNYTKKIYDNLYGEIEISDPRFIKELSRDVYRDLMSKNQIGLTAVNSSYTGGKHTRYDHSIGTFYLAKLFFEKNSYWFLNELRLTEKEVEFLSMIFQLTLLRHDWGHRAFSHVYGYLPASIGLNDHEANTCDMILDIQDETDEIFGKDTTICVLAVLKGEKEIIKLPSRLIRLKNALRVLNFLVDSPLDFDKMDYYSRDMLNVFGQRVSYLQIYDYFGIKRYANGRTKVYFNEEATNLISEFLTKLAQNYPNIYYHIQTNIRERILIKLLCSDIFSKDEVRGKTTQAFINERIRENCDNKDYYIQRLCKLYCGELENNILMYRARSNINYYELLEDLKKYMEFGTTYFDGFPKERWILNRGKTIWMKNKKGELVDSFEYGKNRLTGRCVYACDIYVDFEAYIHTLKSMSIPEELINSKCMSILEIIKKYERFYKK